MGFLRSLLMVDELKYICAPQKCEPPTQRYDSLCWWYRLSQLQSSPVGKGGNCLFSCPVGLTLFHCSRDGMSSVLGVCWRNGRAISSVSLLTHPCHISLPSNTEKLAANLPVASRNISFSPLLEREIQQTSLEHPCRSYRIAALACIFLFYTSHSILLVKGHSEMLCRALNPQPINAEILLSVFFPFWRSCQNSHPSRNCTCSATED